MKNTKNQLQQQRNQDKQQQLDEQQQNQKQQNVQHTLQLQPDQKNQQDLQLKQFFPKEKKAFHVTIVSLHHTPIVTSTIIASMTS